MKRKGCRWDSNFHPYGILALQNAALFTMPLCRPPRNFYFCVWILYKYHVAEAEAQMQALGKAWKSFSFGMFTKKTSVILSRAQDTLGTNVPPTVSLLGQAEVFTAICTQSHSNTWSAIWKNCFYSLYYFYILWGSHSALVARHWIRCPHFMPEYVA